MAIEEDKGTATEAAAGAAAEAEASEFDKAFAEEAAKIDTARAGDAPALVTVEGGTVVEAPVGDQAKDITPEAEATTVVEKPAKSKRKQAKDEEFEHFIGTASIEQLREAHARQRTDLQGKAQVIANDRSTIQELRDKLAAAHAAPVVAAEKAETTETGTDKAKSALLGPKGEELRATYPELAEPLDEIATNLESRLKESDATVAEIRKDRQQTAIVQQTNKLLEDHSYFPEMRETDEFKTFLFENQDDPTLGPVIKANINGIVSARDVSRLVSVFVAESGYEPPEPAPKPAAKAEAGAPETQDARRKAQLRSGTAVQGKGSGPTTTPADDFDQAFAFEAAKTEKELARTGRL